MNRALRAVSGILLAAALFSSCGRETQDPSLALRPDRLRCESLRNPEGISEPAPRLSWSLRSAARGRYQTAYRVLAAASMEALRQDRGDVWDSGQIPAVRTASAVYAGRPLRSGEPVYWKVRVWDENGRESDWSDPAFWMTGPLGSFRWKADWIGMEKPLAGDNPAGPRPRCAARMLRREFDVPAGLRRAVVFYSGLGLCELSLNGRRVGDEVLSPPLSDYSKRVFAVTHDVTPHCVPGRNAIGVTLGNGRYFPPRPDGSGAPPPYPKLILHLRLELEDGSIREIVSDTTWKLTASGPITANNEFDGESHDSRREMPGWDSPGFDDSGWTAARRVAGPAGRLTGRPIAPMRVLRTLKPARRTAGPKGAFVCDMGENIAGWARITLRRPKPGAAVRLRFAETLKPDGGLDTRNLRTALAEDTYIARGDSVETWEPKFTIHGFRYVEVSADRGCGLDSSGVEARVVHDDVERTGAFACSSPVVNRTFDNAVRGILGNYRSIPTDCPQRDERQGWLGDRLASSLGESYVADVHALYAKWMDDIRDSQTESGSIPDVAPPFWKVYTDNVSWPGAYVFIGDMLAVQYGDSLVVRRHYPAMAAWMRYMKRYLSGGLMEKDQYGDWCPPPESPGLIHTADPGRITPPGLIGTALYCGEAELMRSFAHLTGNPDDAREWAGLAGGLREALNSRLWDADRRAYGNGSVTSNLLPLGLGLAPESAAGEAMAAILERILGEYDGHTAVGLVGSQWLMRTLSRNGRPDVALLLAENTTYPSWGYMAEKGATTIWELWNGDTADPSMNSGNHVMLLGDFIPWLFEDVAGIRPDPLLPGFRHILMRPMPAAGLASARATFESPNGLVVSDWRMSDGRFEWSVEVPPNAEAAVFVPAASERDVREGNKPARKSAGVRFVRMENGRAVFSVGSGKYRFTSAGAAPAGPAEATVSTPVIQPSDTSVAAPGTAKISMACRTPGAEIRYTLDGSDPQIRSPLYTEPFETDSPVLVSAAAFKPGMKRSYIRRSRIDVYRPESHGLSCSLYAGFWSALPDFSRIRPVRTVSPADIGPDAVRRPADGFGLVFTGFLKVPAEGQYRFRLLSDDGSRLDVDGRTVVLNDSTHGVAEASGAVRLSEGRHSVRLEYFEARGGEFLRLDWEGPGIPPGRVPRSCLSPK